ncbi:hypothetical protein LCGC14_0195040 [marine sediment metagenome]|uniref:Uncharacterized protein n=1 Tax=marine sediment metagenome TaxID=412755 RepID=A0A0F9X498_9ZZZZ
MKNTLGGKNMAKEKLKETLSFIIQETMNILENDYGITELKNLGFKTAEDIAERIYKN